MAVIIVVYVSEFTKKMAVYLKTQAEMKALTLSTDKAHSQVSRHLKKA